MAGASITIDLQDRDVLAALGELQRRGGNYKDFFAHVGESMLISTRARFADQQSPEGEPWAPLSPSYLKTKKKNKDKILVLDGYLRGPGLAYQADANSLLFGSTRVYGATHQFGAKKGSSGTSKRGSPIPWGDIPARPFIGVSEDDKRMILDTLSDYLGGWIS